MVLLSLFKDFQKEDETLSNEIVKTEERMKEFSEETSLVNQLEDTSVTDLVSMVDPSLAAKIQYLLFIKQNIDNLEQILNEIGNYPLTSSNYQELLRFLKQKEKDYHQIISDVKGVDDVPTELQSFHSNFLMSVESIEVIFNVSKKGLNSEKHAVTQTTLKEVEKTKQHLQQIREVQKKYLNEFLKQN